MAEIKYMVRRLTKLHSLRMTDILLLKLTDLSYSSNEVQ